MAHPKGALIERCKKLGLPKPVFDTKRTGPEHDPTFISDVLIDGEVYGAGQGGNKRDAEKNASEEALAYLDRTETSVTNATQAPVPDEAFEGPWPIFPEVLATSLNIANSRVDTKQQGEDALAEIQALALRLYKGSLENLGEVVEEEEDEE